MGGLMGRMGQCTRCKRAPVMLVNKQLCQDCTKREAVLRKAEEQIAQHPDIIALDAELDRWYA